MSESRHILDPYSTTRLSGIALGEKMGTDIKRVQPSYLQATKTHTQSSELGYAVESEVIPTLLKQLERGTRLPELRNSDGQTQMTWVESLSRQHGDHPSHSTQESRQASTKAVAHRTPGWVSPDVFATMVLDDSDDRSRARFDQLRAEGMDDETLLLELLAPTSVELGRRWELDQCDFADVTIGVCRLHQLLRSLHPQHMRELDHSAHGGRVLLTTAPSEQHSFGLLMVGELLFRAGWYTDVDIDTQPQLINRKVSKHWYELAGVSVGGESQIAGTKALITDLRKHSCNRDIAIVVGGSLINDHPELGRQLGADQVITQAENLSEVTSRYIPDSRRN